MVQGELEETRQPLDIAKELFTTTDALTKSKLSGKEIIIVSRALWYGEKYGIPEIGDLVNKILLLKRSEGGMVLKYFKDIMKSMKPTFETKEGGDVRV